MSEDASSPTEAAAADNSTAIPTTDGIEIKAAAASSAANENSTPIKRTLYTRAQIQTARLDARDLKPSWPLAIASLEQLSSWGVLALRLGTLALIQQCVRELSEQDARADLVVSLRDLVDALAHMPLEA